MLSDCTKTGKIIGSKVKSGSGGVAYVKNGTLSVYDITLTGGSATTGGAIVVDKDGTLNLYSGEISGNHVTNGKGGAIYIKSGGVYQPFTAVQLRTTTSIPAMAARSTSKRAAR